MIRKTASSRTGILLSFTCVLVLVLLGLGVGTSFAAKPPGNTAVTLTFRSGPAAALDGVRGDGFPHAATIAGASLDYSWSSGQVSYDLRVDNIYSGDPTNCPEGTVLGTLGGFGNLKVTLDASTWLGMAVGVPQSGFATYNIAFGGANYLLRFRNPDDLNVNPAQNCSTEVTITRTQMVPGIWVVGTDASDIARLIRNSIHGSG